MRIGEIHDLIEKGQLPVENDLKETILDVFYQHGIEKVGKQRYWTKEHPVDWLLRMTQMIEDILSEKKTHEGQEMTEAEVDLHRRCFVTFIRLRRAVKNILKTHDEE